MCRTGADHLRKEDHGQASGSGSGFPGISCVHHCQPGLYHPGDLQPAGQRRKILP